MRARLALAGILGLALLVPATALGAAPEATSLDDAAVAYYLSPDGSRCAILTLAWAAQRSPGGDLSYSQSLDVQLSDPTCQPSNTSNQADLAASDYRVAGLSSAYVTTSLNVAGHPVRVDVAWVATGTPQVYSDLWANNTVVITRDVSARLTGTVLVDGVAWTANQNTAGLRSGAFTSFSGASPVPPATSTAGSGSGDRPAPPSLALLLGVIALGCGAGTVATRRIR